MILETLFKETKTGAVVFCDIVTQGNNIIVTTGQVGTLNPINHRTQCEAKNIGKASATTAEEQAEKEARAKHAKKIKEGYVLDPSGVKVVKLPMKVKGYLDQKKNVKFPCTAGPKLDGQNGEYRVDTEASDPLNVMELFSRGGENFPMPPHLSEDVTRAMNALDTCTLNGELYIHGEHLQDIQSAVKKPNEMSKRLEFHVFDIPDHSGVWTERLHDLDSCDFESDYVKIVPNRVMHSHEDIEEYMQECLALGYEGIVIRNYDGVYEYNVRSSDVFKYKIPLDGEYRVIGYKLDKSGHAVWESICNVSFEEYSKQIQELKKAALTKYIKLHTFNVKRKGTKEQRLEEAGIAEEKVGQWLKIEYESMSKDNKPQKPVGIVWRECDAAGNPTE